MSDTSLISLFLTFTHIRSSINFSGDSFPHIHSQQPFSGMGPILDSKSRNDFLLPVPYFPMPTSLHHLSFNPAARMVRDNPTVSLKYREPSGSFPSSSDYPGCTPHNHSLIMQPFHPSFQSPRISMVYLWPRTPIDTSTMTMWSEPSLNLPQSSLLPRMCKVVMDTQPCLSHLLDFYSYTNT